MKLSIIIPVLNSHEILRRQLLHFEKIGILSDTEIIIVDDGSKPPLEYKGNLPVKIIRTNDYRPWTWALARNRGAKEAKGEYFYMFDIDHIPTKDCIDTACTFGGDKLCFKREYGVLLKDGVLTQDLDILVEYGYDMNRYATRKLTISPLPNNFCMHRDVFFELGGYREDLFKKPYPQGEDRLFKKAWLNYERKHNTKPNHYSPTMYMFPNGYKSGDVDFNPFGLFHKLTRKTKRNYWYRKQEALNG